MGWKFEIEHRHTKDIQTLLLFYSKFCFSDPFLMEKILYTDSNRPFWVLVLDQNQKSGFGCKLVGTVNVPCTLKFLVLTFFLCFPIYMALLGPTRLFIFGKSSHTY